MLGGCPRAPRARIDIVEARSRSGDVVIRDFGVLLAANSRCAEVHRRIMVVRDFGVVAASSRGAGNHHNIMVISARCWIFGQLLTPFPESPEPYRRRPGYSEFPAINGYLPFEIDLGEQSRGCGKSP